MRTFLLIVEIPWCNLLMGNSTKGVNDCSHTVVDYAVAVAAVRLVGVIVVCSSTRIGTIVFKDKDGRRTLKLLRLRCHIIHHTRCKASYKCERLFSAPFERCALLSRPV
jgi:hypothetical protein